MSLLEILVVVAIFAILGIITTRAVLLTLTGSKKSESVLKVRENLDYSLAVIERQLKNADAVSLCPNPNPNILVYTDNLGNSTSFSCVGVGGEDAYVASGAARLTSNEIKVTSCSFTCSNGSSALPPSILVSFEAKESKALGIEGASVSVSTKINLRTY